MSFKSNNVATPLNLARLDCTLLELAASNASNYPGIQWDTSPDRLDHLEKLGFVKRWQPNNGTNYDRAIITEKGRAAWAGMLSKARSDG